MKHNLPPPPVTVYRGPWSYCLTRSRAVWCALGFFGALMLAGYVAGLIG